MENFLKFDNTFINPQFIRSVEFHDQCFLRHDKDQKNSVVLRDCADITILKLKMHSLSMDVIEKTLNEFGSSGEILRVFKGSEEYAMVREQCGLPEAQTTDSNKMFYDEPGIQVK